MRPRGTVKAHYRGVTNATSVPYRPPNWPDPPRSGKPLAVGDSDDDARGDVKSEHLFRDVFAAAPIAQATIGRDARFMLVNRAACDLVGYTECEVIGQDFTMVVAAESVVATTEAFLELISGDVSSVRLDVTLLRKDRTTRIAEVFGAAVPGPDGLPLYLVVLAQDVTDKRRAESRILHQAMNDELTELPNRGWFAERLAQAVARLERNPGSILAVFFVDLDGFKDVNDRYGHLVGDEALFVAAGRIRATVRPSDTVARHGGDEFTVLCEDLATADDAVEIAERLLKSFGRSCRLSTGSVRLQTSVGVALTEGGSSPAALIALADQAMYSSKQAGKGTYRVLTTAPLVGSD